MKYDRLVDNNDSIYFSITCPHCNQVFEIEKEELEYEKEQYYCSFCNEVLESEKSHKDLLMEAEQAKIAWLSIKQKMEGMGLRPI